MTKLNVGAFALVTLVMAGGTLSAQTTEENGCAALPTHTQLRDALRAAVSAEGTGLNLNMWATIVDRDGTVCAVAYSGSSRGSQWLGSRVISAQKANTANAFSLDSSSAGNSSGAASGLSLSTANLYTAVQPGGSLFGLQESNPINTEVAYAGPASKFGASDDPMVGHRVGGVNVFGGGLALYTREKTLVGAVGVSGDTSCADHRIAWRVRNALVLDYLSGVGGVSGDAERPDNIVFDIDRSGVSFGGFGHPSCGVGDGSPTSLPQVR